MPRPDRQASAKRSEELMIFTGFMRAAGLEAAAIRQAPPPAPDVVCTIAGRERAFELVRLANPGFVENIVGRRRKASREGVAVSAAMTGFADSTWTTLLPAKNSKTYATSVPVELLIWLDWSRDPMTAETVRICLRDVRAFVQGYSQFCRVWLFDPAQSKVLLDVEPKG